MSGIGRVPRQQTSHHSEMEEQPIEKEGVTEHLLGCQNHDVELEQELQFVHNKFDANHDGHLSKTELAQGLLGQDTTTREKGVLGYIHRDFEEIERVGKHFSPTEKRPEAIKVEHLLQHSRFQTMAKTKEEVDSFVSGGVSKLSKRWSRDDVGSKVSDEVSSVLISLLNNDPTAANQFFEQIGDGVFHIHFPGREPIVVTKRNRGGHVQLLFDALEKLRAEGKDLGQEYWYPLDRASNTLALLTGKPVETIFPEGPRERMKVANALLQAQQNKQEVILTARTAKINPAPRFPNQASYKHVVALERGLEPHGVYSFESINPLTHEVTLRSPDPDFNRLNEVRTMRTVKPNLLDRRTWNAENKFTISMEKFLRNFGVISYTTEEKK